MAASSFSTIIPVDGAAVSVKVCKKYVETVITESTLGSELGQQITLRLSPQNLAAWAKALDTALCYFNKQEMQ